MAKKKFVPVILENVKDSVLGTAIEGVQSELYVLEELYKKFVDTDPETALKIKQFLGNTDWLTHCYAEVSGYL